LGLEFLNPSILKTQRPPVTCALSNSYRARGNASGRAAAPSRASGFVLWRIPDMTAIVQFGAPWHAFGCAELNGYHLQGHGQPACAIDTARYLGVDVEDAVTVAEGTESGLSGSPL